MCKIDNPQEPSHTLIIEAHEVRFQIQMGTPGSLGSLSFYGVMVSIWRHKSKMSETFLSYRQG